MQRHRVFIAINLPEDIKRSLAPFQKMWSDIPVKWVRPENLHITLEFLGYVKDEELVEIFKNTQEITLKHSVFDINLTKICYGPLNKPPRMIWAVGEESKELSSLKKDLAEDQGFIVHITLGRLRKWEWQRIEPEDRPEIDQDIDLNFTVNSIEIMESVLKRGGSEYKELSSFDLK